MRISTTTTTPIRRKAVFHKTGPWAKRLRTAAPRLMFHHCLPKGYKRPCFLLWLATTHPKEPFPFCPPGNFSCTGLTTERTQQPSPPGIGSLRPTTMTGHLSAAGNSTEPCRLCSSPPASLAQMALDNLLALCHLLAKAGGVVSPWLLADGHQQLRTGSHLFPLFGSRC